MIRNLKALGLALIAVFAMSAFAASAASAAQQLTTEGEKAVTLEAVETGETMDNSFTAFESTVHCPGSKIFGHKVNTTPHQLVPHKAASVTLTPDWAEPCHVSGGRQATIDMNTCDFAINIGETTGGGAGTYGATVDIECDTEGDSIRVTVFNNTPPSAEGAQLCNIQVTEQTGLKGLHVTNKAAGEGTPKDYLAVAGTVEGIIVHRTGLCVFDGKGTTWEAVQHIDANVKAVDSEGNATGITVSDN